MNEGELTLIGHYLMNACLLPIRLGHATPATSMRDYVQPQAIRGPGWAHQLLVRDIILWSAGMEPEESLPGTPGQRVRALLEQSDWGR